MNLNDYLEAMGITLVPLENFIVEPNFNPMADHGDHYFSMHLDGVLIRPIKCKCSSKQLFDYGCACGGC